MKKMLAMFAITAAVVACNTTTEEEVVVEEVVVDSTALEAADTVDTVVAEGEEAAAE
jgi:uncharacterized protein YcfL